MVTRGGLTTNRESSARRNDSLGCSFQIVSAYLCFPTSSWYQLPSCYFCSNKWFLRGQSAKMAEGRLGFLPLFGRLRLEKSQFLLYRAGYARYDRDVSYGRMFAICLNREVLIPVSARHGWYSFVRSTVRVYVGTIANRNFWSGSSLFDDVVTKRVKSNRSLRDRYS